jgi:hypothetical protein
VDPHPDPKLHSLSEVLGSKRPLRLDRCRDRCLGAREGIEQCVSLSVDLDPAVRRERIPQELAVFREHGLIAGAE